MSIRNLCIEKLSYDKKTGVFRWLKNGTRGVKAGDKAGWLAKDGYVMLCVGGKRMLAHRVAWLFEYGCFPDGHLDHINRIKADNRISNLRDATPKQNAQNRDRNSRNTSGFKGVTWHKRDKKWQAAITVDGKVIHLGYYSDSKDASNAYVLASKKYQTHSIFKG